MFHAVLTNARSSRAASCRSARSSGSSRGSGSGPATALARGPLVSAGPISIEYPMAVVIRGGLVTSTLLNLFVMPSLYMRFGRSRGFAFDRRLAHAGAAAVLLLVAALALGACGGGGASDEPAVAAEAPAAPRPATDRDLPRAKFSH